MADPQQNRPQSEAKRQGRPPHESTSWHPHNARKWKTSTGGQTVKKSASLGSKYKMGIVCVLHPDSFAALRCEYSVLSIISQVPSPIGHYRIIRADCKSDVLVLGSPKARWHHFGSVSTSQLLILIHYFR
ncbi:hypothetical protein E8E15_005725 [Penicillium rubens]|uniref:Uncharacterized protein n=1 Tax=Penicillium rubens (strain ATCC 28089 / DSM 1075 / NRRL 1951 / Wisconsin 54-1255) TaxID=500485 RepID=B6HJ09_PENRW|nr:uncharacterized protein N7525_008038 [Penicillium rubens]KAF3021741.1 hypothetical protein E8E15_005725 [Penicillium rubens]KAJ5829785.1 hypothetical protein N7525_008038 [Penicillium rubens]KAJ5853369.1 hypothetical protein N7534_005912 [Penicillium rubens]CAP96391.1 hypothetical protein PCH_Pc21g14940 [Penicillium rubens Wisconsin 54-1255]